MCKLATFGGCSLVLNWCETKCLKSVQQTKMTYFGSGYQNAFCSQLTFFRTFVLKKRKIFQLFIKLWDNSNVEMSKFSVRWKFWSLLGSATHIYKWENWKLRWCSLSGVCYLKNIEMPERHNTCTYVLEALYFSDRKVGVILMLPLLALLCNKRNGAITMLSVITIDCDNDRSSLGFLWLLKN